MTKIAGVTRFDRPVEEVLDFLADPRNEPRYNPLILDACPSISLTAVVFGPLITRCGDLVPPTNASR